METAVAKLPVDVVQTPEAIVNDETRTFTEADFPVGTVAHQGDLILLRLNSLPANAKPRTNRQLAEGSTQGARHILTAGDAYDCPADDVVRAIFEITKRTVGTQYIGPVFCTDRKGTAALAHPEHGDHVYNGDMAIAVIYQRSLDAEEREARVRD